MFIHNPFLRNQRILKLNYKVLKDLLKLRILKVNFFSFSPNMEKYSLHLERLIQQKFY